MTRSLMALLPAAVSILLATDLGVQAQWQPEPEFYHENRQTGLQTYYSRSYYSELDPASLNARSYYYDASYGKDYEWKNYDSGIYSERVFKAQYSALTYYTDENDEITDWGYQMGVAGAIAGGCCVLIAVGVISTQCIVKKRKRHLELKQQRELADMEGIEMESNSDEGESPEGTDDDKNKKSKTTMEMKKKALEKLAKEAIADESTEKVVVADFSVSDHINEGSRREMLNESDSVQGDETPKRAPVGNGRFDANDGGADEVPDDDEEGGGFF